MNPAIINTRVIIGLSTFFISFTENKNMSVNVLLHLRLKVKFLWKPCCYLCFFYNYPIKYLADTNIIKQLSMCFETTTTDLYLFYYVCSYTGTQ